MTDVRTLLVRPDGFVPKERYTTRDFAELEQTRLWPRVWQIACREEQVAEPGDFVFKARDQWHTFWNAGDEPCRILEIISPGGFEHMFREMGELMAAPDPEVMADFTRRYGIHSDGEGSVRVAERFGLEMNYVNAETATAG